MSEVKMRTLECELGGHTWERESQRGRLPRSCPKCINDAGATVKANKPKTQAVPNAAWISEANGFLIELSQADPGRAHKLRYLIDQIASGKRDEDDVKAMKETAQPLMRWMERNR